jgi:tetratricopeptide (TPR) repeat protein
MITTNNLLTKITNMDVQKITHTVSEYIEVLRSLSASSKTMIYRGQADSKWEIESSAYRELVKNGVQPVTPSTLRDYHFRLIDGVRHLHDDSLTKENDISILAQLQHNYAKTILIDYTYNPLAALWFACDSDNTNEKVDGCVYAIEESFTQGIFPLNTENIDVLFKSSEHTYVYHPYQISQRIINQQSVFLINWMGTMNRYLHHRIIIPKECKDAILQELGVLGVTRKTLFPDFHGYIETFRYEAGDKKRCSNLVLKARELLAEDKPNFNDAMILLKDALALTDSYNGTEDKAYVLHELGHVLYRSGDVVESVKSYKKALSEKKWFCKEDSLSVVSTETAIGLAYLKSFNYDEAMPLFEKAKRIYCSYSNTYPPLANVYSNIANILRAKGECEQAVEMAENAEKIANNNWGSESKECAYIKNCVGSVYAQLGRDQDALDKYETSLRIFKQRYNSESNLDTVYTYLKIASLFSTKEDENKQKYALDKCSYAISLLDKMPQNKAVKRLYGQAHTVKAECALTSGDYDLAIEECEKSIADSTVSGDAFPKIAYTNKLYGEALSFKKKYEKAADRYMMAYLSFYAISPSFPQCLICREKMRGIYNSLKKTQTSNNADFEQWFDEKKAKVEKQQNDR